MKNGRKIKFWFRHIEAYKSSGLALAEYCKRQGLRYSSFRYWHKRLVSKPPKTESFIKITPRAELPADCPFVIETATGLKLSLPSLPPIKWLIELMENFQ